MQRHRNVEALVHEDADAVVAANAGGNQRMRHAIGGRAQASVVERLGQEGRGQTPRIRGGGQVDTVVDQERLHVLATRCTRVFSVPPAATGMRR